MKNKLMIKSIILPLMALLLFICWGGSQSVYAANQVSNQNKGEIANAYFTIGKEAYLKGQKFSLLNDSLLKLQKKGATAKTAFRDSMRYWYQKADSSFATLTRISPDYAGGYIWKGRMDNMLDPGFRKDDAKNSYEKALTISLKDPVKYKAFILEAYKYLGTYYYTKSEQLTSSDKTQKDQLKNTSKDYWSKVLAFDPNDKQAGKIIQLMNKPAK